MPISQLTGFGGFRGVLTFQWAPNPVVEASDFDAAAAYVENMQPPLYSSRGLIQADIRENFEGQHDPDGNAWEPWSRSYVASGPPGPPVAILNRYGALKKSASGAGAFNVTAREIFYDFGALPEYGIWHQEGAPGRAAAGRGRTAKKAAEETAGFLKAFPGYEFPKGESLYANPLPARPFAGVSEETQFQILDVFDTWFGEATLIMSGLSGYIHSGGTIQSRVAGGRWGPKIGKIG
jgi:hypothetical protein